jgi:hypothetical protein
VSTWKRTEQAMAADMAVERVLAVHARCCALSRRFAQRGDAAGAADALAIAEQAVAGHEPIHIHVAAGALGISHAEAVALTRDGTLPRAPWTGHLRVHLGDVARLVNLRGELPAPTPPRSIRRRRP